MTPMPFCNGASQLQKLSLIFPGAGLHLLNCITLQMLSKLQAPPAGSRIALTVDPFKERRYKECWKHCSTGAMRRMSTAQDLNILNLPDSPKFEIYRMLSSCQLLNSFAQSVPGALHSRLNKRPHRGAGVM
jgi:hypothetical protein